MANIQPKRYFNLGLKALSVVFTSIIILCYVFAFLYTSVKLSLPTGVQTAPGHSSLAGFDAHQGIPYRLDGQWEHFPGAVDPGDGSLQGAQPGGFLSLPIGDITHATGGAAFRLSVTLERFESPLYLYLPHLKEPVSIYVNGVLCPSADEHPAWMDVGPIRSVYRLEALDSSLAEQELVIFTCAGADSTALYQRPVIIGSLNHIVSHSFVSIANEMLAFGAISLIMVTGYIYMFFLPDHTLMTLITAFDTFLMLRVAFRLDEVLGFFGALFPSFALSDSAALSIQVFLLMLSGIMGVLLAHHLFDTENVIPRIFTIAPIVLFGVLALTLPFSPALFDSVGIPASLVALAFTFLVVFWQFTVYWRNNRDFYAKFQMVKTLLIGVVIFFDLFTLKHSVSFLPFTCMYLLFFLAHVTTRQYDSNVHYKAAARLNLTLESTVAERTRELATANRILSELSIRDPLTNAFNRLYLEQLLEKRIPEAEQSGEPFYCCMFDLDHFKSINDTYGHDIGDEQLVAAVDAVAAMIPPDAILTRVGGEEFIILLFHLDDAAVLESVEHIRHALEEMAHRNAQRTTASFGVVKLLPGMTMKDLLKHADTCLYAAKHAGRNRVEHNFTGNPQEP